MLLTMMMSNSDLFDKMYQEIVRQNTFYFWIIGIVVTVAIAITAFLGILQWRLSDKQIERMKSDIRQKLVDDYSIDSISNISKQVSGISQRLSSLENGAKDWRAFVEKTKAESLRSFMRQMDELSNRLTNIKYNATVPEGKQETYQEILSSIKAMCENQLVDMTTKAFCIYQIYELIDGIPQSEKGHKEYWQSIIRNEAGEELEVGKQFQENIIDSFNNFNKKK